MELDFRKKLIIGGFIVVVLAVFAYLYYDYKENEKVTSFSIEESEVDEIKESEISKNENEKKEDIIIIHITGAVNNPRNYKN